MLVGVIVPLPGRLAVALISLIRFRGGGDAQTHDARTLTAQAAESLCSDDGDTGLFAEDLHDDAHGGRLHGDGACEVAHGAQERVCELKEAVTDWALDVLTNKCARGQLHPLASSSSSTCPCTSNTGSARGVLLRIVDECVLLEVWRDDK